jgi:transglutaminase-like putative cysteine protease
MRCTALLLCVTALSATAASLGLLLPARADQAASPPAAPAPAPQAFAPSETVFDVNHSITVKDLPEGARQVRVWFWMPEDRPEQTVRDFRLAEAPDGTRLTRDPGYGRSWVYAEAAADPDRPARLVTTFTLARRSVGGLADAARATPVTEEHRRTFARELRRDEKHMEVTPEIQAIADELCGDESNPVTQARLLFHYVILKSDHYSKFGPTPVGLCLGDAMECLAGTGDCCTDQHALFIALMRARGVPCRLVFGSRLQPRNEGQDHDPGYRCWPLFFAPGIGWVPLDISAADTASEAPERWFGGLDENRVEWAEGRDFELEPRSAVRPDLVIRGWVEVDGKVHEQFDRVVHFRRR